MEAMRARPSHLQFLGCDLIQGFLFSESLLADEVYGFIADWEKRLIRKYIKQ